MREELASRVGPVFWSDLAPHAARGALVVVHASLDLVDCGVAVAEDDAARVKAWLAGGLLTRPTEADLARWGTETRAGWNALVVAPYVLVQERDLDAS